MRNNYRASFKGQFVWTIVCIVPIILEKKSVNVRTDRMKDKFNDFNGASFIKTAKCLRSMNPWNTARQKDRWGAIWAIVPIFLNSEWTSCSDSRTWRQPLPWSNVRHVGYCSVFFSSFMHYRSKWYERERPRSINSTIRYDPGHYSAQQLSVPTRM
jgi:hypothetical protein